MIPSKLRLSGFLSYRQPVELDFDSFELACISGSNGAGKSSLLDAITWVIFGEARRTDEDIINNKSEQAEVGLDFFYEGEMYRIQRSKQRNKTTVLDFFIRQNDEGWTPLTEATLRKTEEKIQETLRMDYEVFTNASFFLQGKADEFATQKAGDRKRILGSILGLDQWETYKERANAYRKELEKEETRTLTSLKEWEREIGEEEQRRSELLRLSNELKEKNALLESKEQNLRSLRDLKKSLEGLQKLVLQQKNQMDSLQQEVSDTQTKIEKRNDEIVKFNAVMSRSDEIGIGYAQYCSLMDQIVNLDKLAAEHNSLEKNANESRMLVERTRTVLQTELKNYENQSLKVKKALQDREKSLAELESTKTQVGELANPIAKKVPLKEQEAQLQEQLSIKSAENKQLKIEMEKLKTSIEQLQMNASTCPFCGKPLTEEDRLKHAQNLEEEGKVRGDQYRANEAVLKEIQRNLVHMREDITEIERIEQNSQMLQRKVSALEQQAKASAGEISDWEANGVVKYEQIRSSLEQQDFEKEHKEKLLKAESAIRALGYDQELHEALRSQKSSLVKFDGEQRILDTAKAQSGPLKRELTDLVQQAEKKQVQLNDIQQAYQEQQDELENGLKNLPDLELEEGQYLEIQKELNRIQQETGAAKQRVEVLKHLKDQVQAYNEQLSQTRQEIMRTKQLETAFGANGIPALLVEEALPALQDRANEILDRLSSGSMSVRFDTQKELKSKDEKRETLDITITDPAGTRPYEMFSGGEAFRVNFAIRLALSHLLTQRAGARLQTLVIDEGFGSQDSDGRQRLIEAINQVKSDFKKIIVITHLEEFKDAFPAKIEVEKTLQGSTLKVVSA